MISLLFELEYDDRRNQSRVDGVEYRLVFFMVYPNLILRYVFQVELHDVLEVQFFVDLVSCPVFTLNYFNYRTPFCYLHDEVILVIFEIFPNRP